MFDNYEYKKGVDGEKRTCMEEEKRRRWGYKIPHPVQVPSS